MRDGTRKRRHIHPLWWAASLFAVVVGGVVVCVAQFVGSFNDYVPVTLVSDRAGLVMESGAKVKLRGVEVGRVAGITGGARPVSLKLEIFPDQVRHIPANVEAEIRSTTAFGAKYVDLVYPASPSPARLAAGEVLRSRNVSSEVNTVFENLVGVLKQIDVTKLNATLAALADGVRGQGPRIGEATADANQVLLALNPRMDTVAQDWRSFKGFNDAYSAAAQDILSTLSAASVTSTTISTHSKDLDALLLNTIGFSVSATNLLVPNKDNLVHGLNGLAPTTDLLLKYAPEYTCLAQGAKFFLDHGGYEQIGGNGKSIILDAALLLGDDPYRYPENLPIVAGKGGPGGKPGCGSLPDASRNFPVRQIITDTGWGTGLDWRPNPGIGHPWWVDYFPVTRAVPEPPSIRGMTPPAIGPVPYPGAPPYGAPLYGTGGTPLYPEVPPPQPPGPPPAPQLATPSTADGAPPSP